MRSRGGQFYLFDAFFAATILLLGIGFLVADFTASPVQAQTQVLVADVSTAMSSQPLGEIFNEYTTQNFEILNLAYTPAQQVHAWWYNVSCGWCQDNATALVRSLIAPVALPQHGINITISNSTHTETVFSQSTTQRAQLMIVNHQVLVTDTPQGFLGPDNLEVRVWQ